MNEEKKLIVIHDIATNISRYEDSLSIRTFILNEIERAFKYDFAVFDICKVRNTKTELVDPLVKSKYDSDFERNFLYQYDTKFMQSSYTRWLHNESKSLVMRDEDVIPYEIKKESRYYKEYLSPNGFEYVLNCEYAYNSITFASLTFYNSKDTGPFSDMDVYFMKLLIPCIVSALNDATDIEITNDATDLLKKHNLTKREMEIVNLVFDGLSNREIANTLFVSENTIKKHLNNIYQKINLPNRTRLINFLNQENYRTM